ncbi:hypothetical protein BJ742DRAFT_855361 [Cladochytrium replicatum]|nr:hypothetical protein BJ742DRAFT_855361 [Cladochytrium replicatum]
MAESPHQSTFPPNAPRQLAILVAFNSVVIATTIWLIAWRRQYSIRARGVGLIVAQTTFGIIATVSVNLQYALGGPFQCFWVLVGQTWGMNLLIATVPARVIRLKRIYSFHKRAIARYTQFNSHGGARFAEGVDRDGEGDIRVRFEYPEASVSGVHEFLKARYKIERIASVKAWIFVAVCFVCNTVYTIVVAFVDRRMVAEDFFSPYDFSIAEGRPGLTRRGADCSTEYWVFWPTYAIYAFASTYGAARCLYSLRKIRDTHDMRLDLSINLVVATPCFVYFMISIAVLQKHLDPNLFSWLQPGVATYLIVAVNHITSVLLPIYRDLTESRRAKRLEINMTSLKKVLHDPALFSRFKAFAARDLCSEQVIFLEELRVFEAKLAMVEMEGTNRERVSLRPSKSKLSLTSQKLYPPPRLDSSEIDVQNSNDIVDDIDPASPALVSQDQASSRDDYPDELRTNRSLRSHFKTICDLFIRSGSPMELNLSYPVRQACIEAADADVFTIGMFDGPRNEVVKSLVSQSAYGSKAQNSTLIFNVIISQFADTYPKFISCVRREIVDDDIKSKNKLVADAIIVA